MDRTTSDGGLESNRAEGRARTGLSDEKQKHREGPLALGIEQQTAKLPSDVFLWAAFGSIATAAFLQARGQKANAAFVGHWAPTFLVLGLYNKIVKVLGSDRVGSHERANVNDPMDRLAESMH